MAPHGHSKCPGHFSPSRVYHSITHGAPQDSTYHAMTKMDPKIILARLSKLTGSVNGLDACLMLAQYSSPFIIALLLRLSRIRSSLTSAAAEKVVVGHGVLGTVEGVKNVAGALGDARAVMRAFGESPLPDTVTVG